MFYAYKETLKADLIACPDNRKTWFARKDVNRCTNKRIMFQPGSVEFNFYEINFAACLIQFFKTEQLFFF